MTNDSSPVPEKERIEHAQDQPGESENAPPDPFSPESLRLDQDFASTVAVKKVLTTITCRKPKRQEFVRVRAGDVWRLETAAYEDQVNKETFLVERSIRPELEGEIYPVCLFLAINRQNDVFLWPVKMPGPDGRSNTWNESALEAARMAEESWIRVASNMSAGMYDTYKALADLPEPVWPQLSWAEIIKLCFRDRLIQDMDHPVLRALRGEM